MIYYNSLFNKDVKLLTDVKIPADFLSDSDFLRGQIIDCSILKNAKNYQLKMYG